MTPDRITSLPANLSFEFQAKLRRFFERDGVCPEEQALLDACDEIVQATDHADVSVSVALAAFRANGINGYRFRRRLKEADGKEPRIVIDEDTEMVTDDEAAKVAA